MADWVGRGGGRKSAQPSGSFSGGAGMGSGRAGAQPSLAANANVELAERSYSLKGSTAISAAPRSHAIKGAVDYGGTSKAKGIKRKIGDANPGQRGGSTFAANAEKNPRVADPEGNFIFTLEIDGIEVAQFKECSGLKSSTTIFELEEGGVNHRVHKLAGQSRWENIVLRYGVTSDTSLLKWRSEVIQDQFNRRRNGSIVMMTLNREEVRRYHFVHAWPVAWEGPAFDANGADLAVEMVEIAHHGISVT